MTKPKYFWIGFGTGGPHVLEHPPSTVDEEAFRWVRVRACKRENPRDKIKLMIAADDDFKKRWAKIRAGNVA